MKGRSKRPSAEDVRGLMAELGEMVDELGLQPPPAAPAETEPDTATSAPAEGVAAAAPAEVAGAAPVEVAAAAPVDAAPPAPVEVAAAAPAPVDTVPPAPIAVPAAPVAMPTPVVSAAPPAEVAPAAVPAPEEAVPMWESAAPEAPAAPAEPTPAPRSWEQLAPTTPDVGGRPWSPAAAMVMLEPIAPPGTRGAAAPTRTSRGATSAAPRRLGRPHGFTLVTAAAVVIAGAVFAFSHLDLGHTSGPSQAVVQTAFQVTGLRTVAASSPRQVSTAQTLRQFPSNATAIYIDINYRNVTPSAALRVIILLQPDQSGDPPATVSDNTHTNLDPGGEIAVTVDAPPGGFAPGTYTVRALHDGHLDQTWTFQVNAAP